MTRRQKRLLYKAGVCPRLCWDLTVVDLLPPWIHSSLEAMATKVLKTWSGLAHSGNTARLYLPQANGGLALPSLSVLYKKFKVSQTALFLTSRDRGTQQVALRALQDEESQTRSQFNPNIY